MEESKEKELRLSASNDDEAIEIISKRWTSVTPQRRFVIRPLCCTLIHSPSEAEIIASQKSCCSNLRTASLPLVRSNVPRYIFIGSVIVYLIYLAVESFASLSLSAALTIGSSLLSFSALGPFFLHLNPTLKQRLFRQFYFLFLALNVLIFFASFVARGSALLDAVEEQCGWPRGSTGYDVLVMFTLIFAVLGPTLLFAWTVFLDTTLQIVSRRSRLWSLSLGVVGIVFYFLSLRVGLSTINPRLSINFFDFYSTDSGSLGGAATANMLFLFLKFLVRTIRFPYTTLIIVTHYRIELEELPDEEKEEPRSELLLRLEPLPPAARVSSASATEEATIHTLSGVLEHEHRPSVRVSEYRPKVRIAFETISEGRTHVDNDHENHRTTVAMNSPTAVSSPGSPQLAVSLPSEKYQFTSKDSPTAHGVDEPSITLTALTPSKVALSPVSKTHGDNSAAVAPSPVHLTLPIPTRTTSGPLSPSRSCQKEIILTATAPPAEYLCMDTVLPTIGFFHMTPINLSFFPMYVTISVFTYFTALSFQYFIPIVGQAVLFSVNAFEGVSFIALGLTVFNRELLRRLLSQFTFWWLIANAILLGGCGMYSEVGSGVCWAYQVQQLGNTAMDGVCTAVAITRFVCPLLFVLFVVCLDALPTFPSRTRIAVFVFASLSALNVFIQARLGHSYAEEGVQIYIYSTDTRQLIDAALLNVGFLFVKIMVKAIFRPKETLILDAHYRYM